MHIYGFLDGRILHDSEGRLDQLVQLARAHLAHYRVPADEKRRIAYWLKSARSKMAAAREAGCMLQAAYVASTTSWQVLEGLWAASGRPLPSNGAVRAHVWDLSTTPPLPEELWHRFLAGDAPDRVQAAIEIIDWVVPILEEQTLPLA